MYPKYAFSASWQVIKVMQLQFKKILRIIKPMQLQFSISVNYLWLQLKFSTSANYLACAVTVFIRINSVQVSGGRVMHVAELLHSCSVSFAPPTTSHTLAAACVFYSVTTRG